MNDIDLEIAFICEGETEEVFYKTLVQKYSMIMKAEHYGNDNLDGTAIIIRTEEKSVRISFKCTSTCSQITNQVEWIRNEYADKIRNRDICIYICYDTDSYREDITRFEEGDWEYFIKQIEKISGEINIIQLAAKAQIEDIMLIDKNGIKKYLGLTEIAIPNKSKGKYKMREVFKQANKCYREGYRSERFINSLDFEYICKNCEIIDLKQVIDNIFK